MPGSCGHNCLRSAFDFDAHTCCELFSNPAQVDMDKLEAEGQAAFEGADSVFCCLGTTRPVGEGRGCGCEGCGCEGCG